MDKASNLFVSSMLTKVCLREQLFKFLWNGKCIFCFLYSPSMYFFNKLLAVSFCIVNPNLIDFWFSTLLNLVKLEIRVKKKFSFFSFVMENFEGKVSKTMQNDFFFKSGLILHVSFLLEIVLLWLLFFSYLRVHNIQFYHVLRNSSHFFSLYQPKCFLFKCSLFFILS